MKKYFITGCSGFVGTFLIDLINKKNDDGAVLGVDTSTLRIDPKWNSICVDFKNIDLNQIEDIKNTLSEFKPDFIIHLASMSSVKFSWENPILSFENNTRIFLNILETVRNLQIHPRILSVGSSEEYGQVDPEAVPLNENSPLNPISPYAVARVAQGLFSKLYANSYNLDIVITRSFNHIGPGQSDEFAISSFAKQIAEINSDNKIEQKLHVGDISVVRDYLDVRDVVKAYLMLLESGEKGEVYNICKGEGHSIRDMIDMLMQIANKKIPIIHDSSRNRPADNPIIIGSNAKIKEKLGWEPRYSLKSSLMDVYKYWQDRIRKL